MSTDAGPAAMAPETLFDNLVAAIEDSQLLGLGQLFLEGDSLVKNARLFHQSFDLLPSPIFVKDLSGAYRLANQAFCEQIIGRPRREVVGRTMFELDANIPADLVQQYHAADQALLAAGGEQIYTAQVRCADGRRREFELRKRVLVDGDGEPRGLIGILLDVSARLQAERDLSRSLADAEQLNRLVRQQRDMLVQSEKLASLGQLSAGVAHEINNPLSYVRSNLQSLHEYLDTLLDGLTRARSLLAGDQPVDPEQRAALLRDLADADLDYLAADAPTLVGECLHGVDRIRAIVDAMRGFARVDSQSMVLASAHDMVTTALVMVRNEVKHRARLVVDCRDAPRLRCHRQQIEQVVLNLVVNAAQAMTDRGTITVSATAHPEGICLKVVDDGDGMSEDVRQRVFEPFFTTKAQGEGTGLGLHIVTTIVERHGGRIEVTSSPGQGTEFAVVLPLEPPVS